jgi:hypothetical protein
VLVVYYIYSFILFWVFINALLFDCIGTVLLAASANPIVHTLHLSHLDSDPASALASLLAYLRAKGDQAWNDATAALGPRTLHVPRTPLGQCLDTLPLLVQYGLQGVSTELLKDLHAITKHTGVRIVK